MPSTVVTEALYCQGDSGNTILFVQYGLEKCRQTCCCAFGKLAKQFTVIKKISANDLGNAENILSVRDRIQYVFLKMGCELDHFLGMTRGTKPATTA